MHMRVCVCVRICVCVCLCVRARVSSPCLRAWVRVCAWGFGSAGAGEAEGRCVRVHVLDGGFASVGVLHVHAHVCLGLCAFVGVGVCVCMCVCAGVCLCAGARAHVVQKSISSRHPTCKHT